MRRRRDNRIWYVGLAVFVAAGVFSFLFQREEGVNVEAASLDGFDAGYIISDYQMANYQSMSEKEIQEFLTAKNGCKNTDKELYDSLTAKYSTIHWHFKDGHFVCLSEELFGEGVEYGEDIVEKGDDVDTGENVAGGVKSGDSKGGAKVSGTADDKAAKVESEKVTSETTSGETAAHIIWQAAQDYKINPQVLIVLLEKEQGLVTDTYPHSNQYRSATGYGCPDTAACVSKYYGFKNQVRNAAAMFRTVLDGGWTNYPLGDNYIQYNPLASCGGSVVKVKNLATSALYRYTPYQPNAATLAAGYGTAECGAYGNRNFYLYFEDWFGGIKDEGVKETKAEPKAASMDVKKSNGDIGTKTEVASAEKEAGDVVKNGAETESKATEEEDGKAVAKGASDNDDKKSDTEEVVEETLKIETEYILDDYTLDGMSGMISGMTVKTLVDEFKANIKLTNGYSMDVDSKEIDGQKVIYTGGVTRIKKGGNIKSQLVNVVTGDINGDGVINSADLLKVRQHLLDVSVLEKYFLVASDMDGNGTINSADLLKVRQYLLNTDEAKAQEGE